MHPDPLTPEYLSSLDKSQLIELLQNRTQLLVTASITKIPDYTYVSILKQEVEALQAEIKGRMN